MNFIVLFSRSLFLVMNVQLLLLGVGCASSDHGEAGQRRMGSGGPRQGHGAQEGGSHYGARRQEGTDSQEPLIGKEIAPAFVIGKPDGEKAPVMGTVSCDLWTRSLSEADEGRRSRLNSNISWVYGYLSGLSSATRAGFLETVEASSIQGFISDYCKAHPNMTTAVAAQEYARARLGEKRPLPASVPAKPHH
jgi:hypothetical protein